MVFADSEMAFVHDHVQHSMQAVLCGPIGSIRANFYGRDLSVAVLAGGKPGF